MPYFSSNVNIITVIDTIEINDVAKKMSIKLLCISDRYRYFVKHCYPGGYYSGFSFKTNDPFLTEKQPFRHRVTKCFSPRNESTVEVLNLN